MKSAMRKREVLYSLKTNTQIREAETLRSTEHGIMGVRHLVNRGALNLCHGAFMKRAPLWISLPDGPLDRITGFILKMVLQYVANSNISTGVGMLSIIPGK